MSKTINIGAAVAGVSLTAAGWYNTVIRKKSITGLVCLIAAGVALRRVLK